MRGNNHADDCGCEWCGNVGWNVDSWGGGQGGGSASSFPTRLPVELDAQPEPNANCPVCGRRVHFRKLENGGRVYFDTLGPPWPKHPCTDNTLDEVPRAYDGTVQAADKSASIPTGIADERALAPGWTPVRFVSQKKGSRGDSPAHHLGWTTARARNLATSTWESWLILEPLSVRRFDLAYRSEWDAEGRARVSYLLPEGAHSFMVLEAVVWSEPRFAEVSSDSVLEALTIDAETRGRRAIEHYFEKVDWRRIYLTGSREVILDAIDQTAREVRELGWQHDKEHVAWMRERISATLRRFIPFGNPLLPRIMQLIVAFY